MGQKVKEQVHKTVKRKLEELSGYQEFQTQLDYIKGCLDQIKAKSSGPRVDTSIQATIKEYLNSLTQWGQGAEISQLDHKYLTKLRESTSPDQDADLLVALWLQNDNQGCQSLMLRSSDGSVIFGHTEEDVEDIPGERFDKIYLAKFTIGQGESQQTRYSIVYPDLLPGAGFGFGKDFIYAVDFQHVPALDQPGYLANAGVWATWRLGADHDPTQVLKSLTPYVDGYTLNTVRQIPKEEGPQLEAKKIEFGHGFVEEFVLSDQPGDNFISVNIFEPEGELAEKVEDIDEQSTRDWYDNRVGRAQRAIHLTSISHSLGLGKVDKDVAKRDIGVDELSRMLAFRVGGVTDAALANVDVKAHVVGSMSPTQARILVDSGPATKDEQPIEFNFPNS